MSDRSWFSNLQGAADWATGNKWDFDNMGRPNVSVANNKPPGVSSEDSSAGIYSPSGRIAEALNKANSYQQWSQKKNPYFPPYAQDFDSTGGSYKKLSGSSGMFFPAGTPGHQIVHHGAGTQGGGGGGGSNPFSAVAGGVGTYAALASNPVTAPIAVGAGIVSGLGKLFG